MTRIRLPRELAALDAAFAEGAQAVWAKPRQLIIADAETCRDILWNRQRLYKETSDFFSTRWGILEPREAQIRMGAQARTLLEERIHESDLRGAIDALGVQTRWPQAGNRLFFELLSPALVNPARSARLKGLLGEILENRVYGVSSFVPAFVRSNFRRRASAIWVKEFNASKEMLDGGPRDLIDVILRNADPRAEREQAMQLFVSFLFALAGSMGFALGWSLYLAIECEALDCDPNHLVSEALRLFPVAWKLDRSPIESHDICGFRVTPDDTIVVCPYALHRNPSNWDRSKEYWPQRWTNQIDRSAWLPFGAGPHMCIGVSMTMSLVARALATLIETRKMSIYRTNARPGMGPALRPPQFTLDASRN